MPLSTKFLDCQDLAQEHTFCLCEQKRHAYSLWVPRYLQKATNVSFIMCTHGHYILKEPEERSVVAFFRPQHG